MSCRYPGDVRPPEDLWRLVADGADAIGPFPADRGWDTGALFDPDPDRPGTSYVREGGFLHDAPGSTPRSSGSPRARPLAMDPQQRLLLELAWEAFERAGIDPDRLRGSPTGVFAGGRRAQATLDRAQVPGRRVDGYLAAPATSPASPPAGSSYSWAWKARRVTVDTACSSSLVALHLAARRCAPGSAPGAGRRRHGDGEPGRPFVEFSRQRGLAPDGRCKAFAAAADGTGWSEGRRRSSCWSGLSDARRHGHPVLAVIRGSAVNPTAPPTG